MNLNWVNSSWLRVRGLTRRRCVTMLGLLYPAARRRLLLPFTFHNGTFRRDTVTNGNDHNIVRLLAKHDPIKIMKATTLLH